MFNALSRYLFENKRLVIPTIGVFEWVRKGAEADVSTHTMQPPGWSLQFIQDEIKDTYAIDKMCKWLADNQHISIQKAIEQFELFTTGLKEKLDKGETVVWEGLGKLVTENGRLSFVSEQNEWSPFTQVTAQKVIRRNTNYSTIVGDKETTSEHMRKQLQNNMEAKGSKNKLMWILLTISLIAIAVYFSQNGCNTHATGNTQKVKGIKPSDTYKID